MKQLAATGYLLAATDYLTNPCKLKKMNDKFSVWILNTQVFA